MGSSFADFSTHGISIIFKFDFGGTPFSVDGILTSFKFNVVGSFIFYGVGVYADGEEQGLQKAAGAANQLRR